MALRERLYEALRFRALLASNIEILSWDQEVCMPPRGVAHRATLLGTLANLLHKHITDTLLPLLQEAKEHPELTPAEQQSVGILLEDLEPIVKIPPTLVQELTEEVTLAKAAWVEARKASDFSRFAPHLTKLLHLLRAKAEALGYEREPYEALFRLYEKGITITELEQLFSDLKPFLLEMLHTYQGYELEGPPLALPAAAQKELVSTVLEHLGYDLSRGRIDLSAHPFCAGFSPDDVRLTIRIEEEDFTMALSAGLHEMGHALYEQGLAREPIGWPISMAASLSVHESQSRFWENHIGASLPFWQFMQARILPRYQPSWLSAYTPLTLARRVNKIQPHLIRIQSDEVTYHLHILLRFELERALLRGELSVPDLPLAWNEKVATYLGLTVPNDREGVLQDIHWSMANLGYFPTYSLGSFLAAQFAVAMSRENPYWEEALAEGDASFPLQWLQKNIYAHGALWDSQTLCQKATGEPLSVQYYIQYIRTKLENLYEGLPLATA
ncbi:MAG: carboxypeptidase M32 [Bacteroidia bacterium]|nr:carboxypeptidase M32 [Bacteroidia bacterium]MDW8089264.1 carboxypeptidase M32 [Bacteroidia bacterium]